MTTIEQWLDHPVTDRSVARAREMRDALKAIARFHVLDPYWPYQCWTCSEQGDVDWPCVERQTIQDALGIDGKEDTK